MFRIAAVLISLIAFAPPAFAQTPAEEELAGREHAAWEVAATLLGDTLSPVQHSQFMILAWHVVAGNLCHDLVVDQQTFGAAYAELEHADVVNLHEEEARYFEQHLATNFGVAVGIMLAEHAGAPEEVAAFCDHALEVALSGEMEAYFDEELLSHVRADSEPAQPAVESAEGAAAAAAGGGDTEGLALANSKWRVASMSGADVPADQKMLVEFGGEGQIRGNTGCNMFNGHFALDGDAINIGPLAATRMACPGQLADLENQLFMLLGEAQGVQANGDRLQVLGSGGAVLVELEKLE